MASEQHDKLLRDKDVLFRELQRRVKNHLQMIAALIRMEARNVADNGVGLQEGMSWPKSGKLGAVIAQSLRQNAKARLEVHAAPDAGFRVDIFVAREAPGPAVI